MLLDVVKKFRVPSGFHLLTGCVWSVNHSHLMFTKNEGREEDAAEGGRRWRVTVRGKESTWIREPLEKKGESFQSRSHRQNQKVTKN